MYYPKSMPTEEKSVWSYSDCFSSNNLFLISPFLHSDYTLGMHMHEFFEMNIVLNGEGAHYFCDHIFELKRGDVFVIPSMTPHGYFSSKNLDIYHILIHQNFFERYKIDLDYLREFNTMFHIEPAIREHAGLPLFLHLSDADLNSIINVLDLMRSLDAIKYQNDETHDYIFISLNHLALHLFSMLSHFSESEKNSKYDLNGELIIKSLKHIYSEYDKKISIKELSDELHISRSSYFSLFKQYTGKTPVEYIIEYRLSKAKSLLRFTDTSITDIAQITGFFDSAHFYKIFKKYTGMSPHSFRSDLGCISTLK